MNLFLVISILLLVYTIAKATVELSYSKDVWQGSYLYWIATKLLGKSDQEALTSYFGPNDHTWKRKDHDNKVVNYLRHTIFVFTTDIWHGADTLATAAIIGIPTAILFYLTTWQFALLFFVATYALYTLFFHSAYTFWLKIQSSLVGKLASALLAIGIIVAIAMSITLPGKQSTTMENKLRWQIDSLRNEIKTDSIQRDSLFKDVMKKDSILKVKDEEYEKAKKLIEDLIG